MQIQNKNQMGKVLSDLTVINGADQIRAEDGTISQENVRSARLENVLVDKRVTTLCLPSDAIAKLGLSFLKEVDVASSMGIIKARIFQNATISVCGKGLLNAWN